MRISTKGRYGLRAIVDMARSEDKKQVSVKSIAARENISERYLERIFNTLKINGIIISVRGAGGGYRLARAPDMITVGQILRALEGSLAPVHCVDTTEEGCGNYQKCITKTIWKKINDGVSDIIDNMTISDIIKEDDLLNEELKVESNKV